MVAGEFNDLRHFCFRDLKSENAANAHTMAMDMQHDLHRLFVILPKIFSRMCTTKSIGV